MCASGKIGYVICCIVRLAIADIYDTRRNMLLIIYLGMISHAIKIAARSVLSRSDHEQWVRKSLIYPYQYQQLPRVSTGYAHFGRLLAFPALATENPTVRIPSGTA